MKPSKYAGESLIIYTDGLSETKNSLSAEYGTDRLIRLAADHFNLPPAALIEVCLADVKNFRGGAAKADDLTLMVIRRKGTMDSQATKGT